MKKALFFIILFGLISSVPAQEKNTTANKTDYTTVADSSSANRHDTIAAAGDTTFTEIARKVESDLKPPSMSEIFSVGVIVWTVIFLIIGYLGIRFISFILESIAEKTTKYRIAIKGLIPVIKILGWMFILFIVIAGIIQPPVSTIIAVTASIAIAVGFAAQDILKNIFGGIMILIDRPFQVGDKIEAGNYYGEVVEIGLRSIRLVTPDDSLVSVPNGELMTKSVANANVGELNCQVVAEIYLPITVNTDRVRQIAIESAQVSKYIYLNKPIVVLFFNEVKERRSYLKMRLKAYVADIRYEFAFKSDMTEIVMKELINEKLISPEDFR